MKKINMLTGSPVKSIITFSLPIMASSMLQYNYTFVDNIIVGRYVSPDALAAVGSVGPVNSFIIGAAVGVTAGFSIPISHAFGEGNKDKINRYAGNAVSLSLILGLTIMIVAHLVSPILLKATGVPEEIIGLSSSYVNILYYGVPFQMLSNIFTAIARSVGESKKPLYFFTVSVIVNALLDLLFVKELSLGVEGAALATLISHLIVCIMGGIYIFRFNKDISLSLKNLKPSLAVSRHQIRLGIPVSIQFTVTSVGSMCMQSVVNSFGTEVIAGFTAANKVENLTNIPMSGLGVATQTFVGQNYGAKNYDRIVKSVKKIFLLDLFVSVIMSVTLYLISDPLVSLFMTEKNPLITDAAKSYIQAISLCYSLVAILFVMRNTLQGLGFTYANSVAGIGEFFGRLTVAFVLTPLIGFGAICYAGPIAWLLADIPLVIIYFIKAGKFKKLSS